jgi:hypothetical protein
MTPAEAKQSEAALAPAAPFVLGGRTFLCRCPSISEFSMINAEMRRQIQAKMISPFDIINKRVKEANTRMAPLDQTLLDSMVREAMKSDAAGEKTEPSMEQLTTQAQTVEGARFYAWVLVKQADPTVKLEDMAAMIPDESAAFETVEKMGRVLALTRAHPNS